MDCWGLGAGCCLALPLHSTLLGALIPQAYGREGRAEREKEMGDRGGREEGRGKERGRREGEERGVVSFVLLIQCCYRGVKTMCVQAIKATPAKATTSCQTGSPDTMPTGYWSKQSICQYRPLLGY